MISGKPYLIADEIVNLKTVKRNRNNYWLLELMYGDAADDSTARFQIPHNVVFRKLKIK